jgi:hypothetical protein
MKKKSVLWLLPLAVALLIGSPSALFAKEKAPKAPKEAKAPKESKKDKAAREAAEALAVPPAIETDAEAPVPVENAAIPPASTPTPLSAADSTGVKQADELIGSSTPSDAKLLSDIRDRLNASNSEKVPGWILDPAIIDLGKDADGNPLLLKDYYIGIGSAKGSSDRVSIQMADARARQDIAFQLGVQVRAMITDYAKNVGLEGGEFDEIQTSESEMIGQQLTKKELTNLAVNKREKNDGTWWVIVTMPRKAGNIAATQQAIDDVSKAPQKYAEKAQEMVKLMDEQLAKLKDEQSEKAPTLKPTVEIEE